MLAPRKVLWSTPLEAVDTLYSHADVNGSDTVVDLGCGDGRVLVRWAELYWRHHSADADKGDLPTFVGIDIDSKRIQEAHDNWLQAVTSNRIPARMPVRFHCANAVERLDLWMEIVTVLYVYLTPRGMRQLRPLLGQTSEKSSTVDSTSSQSTTHRLRYVVSYMNPLPQAQLIRRELVRVPHQPDAAWPVFLYKM